MPHMWTVRPSNLPVGDPLLGQPLQKDDQLHAIIQICHQIIDLGATALEAVIAPVGEGALLDRNQGCVCTSHLGGIACGIG